MQWIEVASDSLGEFAALFGAHVAEVADGAVVRVE
jgi:hypothetical protein